MLACDLIFLDLDTGCCRRVARPRTLRVRNTQASTRSFRTETGESSGDAAVLFVSVSIASPERAIVVDPTSREQQKLS
jgi:hypothetical protein